MNTSATDLDQLQAAYRTAVDEWVAAIRAEEALASVVHSEAQIDTWEAACFREEEARERAREAKRAYEAELREKLFHF